MSISIKNRSLAGLVLIGSAAGTFAGVSALESANASTPSSSVSSSHGAQVGAPSQQDLSKLAKSLGVSTTKLESALKGLHAKQDASRDAERNTRDAAIAKKLGVSTSAFQSAMEKNKPTPGEKPTANDATDHMAKVAKSLGVSETKLKEAFDSQRDQNKPKAPQQNANGFAKDLATALGLSESKVESALKANVPSGMEAGSNRSRGRFGGDHGPRGDFQNESMNNQNGGTTSTSISS